MRHEAKLAFRLQPYVPGWAPIFPRDSVRSGDGRTMPIAWICPKGFRHPTRESCMH